VSGLTHDAVLTALEAVEDPELRRSIVALGMVGHIQVDGGRVAVAIKLTVAGCPLKAGIASGKGGVGKSSITANLAVALAGAGHSVALLDADVYGYSIPRMMGVQRPAVMMDELIIPVESHGVRIMSIGFLTEEDSPVIWRGPMLHKALTAFVTDTFWDDPDYLLVDLPPGTGDVSLSIAQLLPTATLVIVTTPQMAAQRVARRAAAMAQRVDLPVAGVIENMSWFVAPDTGNRYEVFSGGGGPALAAELGVPLLGQIPL